MPETNLRITPPSRALAVKQPLAASSLGPADRLGSYLRWSRTDFETGRFRRQLFRFMADSIPLIHACLWTWVRLSSAPGQFTVETSSGSTSDERASQLLNELSDRLFTNVQGNRSGIGSLLPELFTAMYRDGLFAGFLTLDRDGSRVDQFVPLDPAWLVADSSSGKPQLRLEDTNGKQTSLDRPDFYFLPFSPSTSEPFGRSILQAIPFVAYIEQQLVDDMRRTSHNSGYHRLHVKITPPERMSGESDQNYTERINSYFDGTVSMIKSCDIDDNPVTWDNVTIDHVGPSKSREITSSWFMNHRAMVEEVCAGTNLAPYLLGYSFGATTTWSAFKFDVVMRQVRSVQAEVARFLEWIGNVELALHNLDATCRFTFDNAFAYQAKDDLAVRTGEVDNLIRLLDAGLIDPEQAKAQAQKFMG